MAAPSTKVLAAQPPLYIPKKRCALIDRQAGRPASQPQYSPHLATQLLSLVSLLCCRQEVSDSRPERRSRSTLTASSKKASRRGGKKRQLFAEFEDFQVRKTGSVTGLGSKLARVEEEQAGGQAPACFVNCV